MLTVRCWWSSERRPEVRVSVRNRFTSLESRSFRGGSGGQRGWRRAARAARTVWPQAIASRCREAARWLQRGGSFPLPKQVLELNAFGELLSYHPTERGVRNSERGTEKRKYSYQWWRGVALRAPRSQLRVQEAPSPELSKLAPLSQLAKLS